MICVAEHCAAGERCSAFDRRERLAAELQGPGPLCDPCISAGERAVGALVLDYRDLESHLPPSLGVWGDGQPRGSGELRVPMRLAVEALQAEIHWLLTAWEQVVRERERLSDSVTRGVRAGWAVQAAAQILQPRVRLLALLGAVEFAGYPSLDDSESYRWMGIEHAEVPGWRGVLDLVRLHQRAFRLQGLSAAAPEPIDGVPCKNIECDEKDLYRELGNDGVFCGSCGKRYTQEEYESWVRLVHGHVKGKKGRAA